MKWSKLLRLVAAAALVCGGLWLALRGPAAVPPDRSFALYDLARRCGFSDELTPRPFDVHRYDEKYAAYADVPDSQKIAERGYSDGFVQHPEETMNLDEAEYDRDYRRGASDRFEHKPAAQTTRGYRDGFERCVHAFGRPY